RHAAEARLGWPSRARVSSGPPAASSSTASCCSPCSRSGSRMLRRSSTWRSEHRRAHWVPLVLLAGLAATVPRPAAAVPRWCLPRLFEDGARLHPLTPPEVFWLGPLLRQHALCRHARDRPQEQRVLVLGSSGPFGYPLPASQAAPAELDRLLVADGLPARAFNLGFVNTYQLRDAFIAPPALASDPAVIVYPPTLPAL